MTGPYPRTAEDIARSGDLPRCGVRELMDLGRQMGLTFSTDHRPTVLRLVKAEAARRGWLPPRGKR